MDFADIMLRFLVPTHTHDFDNHCNGYVRSNIGLMRSFSGLPKIGFFNGFEARKWFQNQRGL
jgi:hypothetical protein